MNTIAKQLKQFNQEKIDRIIRLDEVKQITQKSKTSIYTDMLKGTFPSSLQIGLRAVGWRLSEIQEWVLNLQPTQEK
jgi:prophage regulatory protein